MNRFTIRKALLLLMLLPALAGCGEVDSTDLTSNQSLYGEFTVSSGGQGSSVVEAKVKVGGPLATTYLNLTGGDHFTADFDGMSVVLNRYRNLLGVISYSNTILNDAPGTLARVSLHRSTAPSLPDTWVILPQRVVITAPAPAAIIPRDGTVTVSWTPAGTPDRITVRFEGNCPSDWISFSSTHSIAGDPGSAVFSVPALMWPLGPVRGDCNVNITVKRRRYGVVDSGYGEGGFISAVQQNSLPVIFR